MIRFVTYPLTDDYKNFKSAHERLDKYLSEGYRVVHVTSFVMDNRTCERWTLHKISETPDTHPLPDTNESDAPTIKSEAYDKTETDSGYTVQRHQFSTDVMRGERLVVQYYYEDYTHHEADTKATRIADALNTETAALRQRIAELEAERDKFSARNNELESVIDIAHDMAIDVYDDSDHDANNHKRLFELQQFIESKLPHTD